MSRRTCDCGCGRKFEAKTSRRRFFETSCRVRASRGAVVDITAKVATVTSPAAADAPAQELPGVYGATYRDLQAADRLNTPLGQSALVLAHRIDRNRDTGSAMATMTRQHGATLAEALKGARREGSKLDELTERRRKRLHRGA